MSETRTVYFASPAATLSAIDCSLSELVAANQEAIVSEFMSTENVLHYHHANSWSYPANKMAGDGEMQAIRAETSIPQQRILDNDIHIITESLSSIGEQLAKGLMVTMYGVLNEACDKSGNVVRNSNQAEAFLEALAKVEFGVNAAGEVELPQVHTGSKDLARILHEQPESFSLKVEEIKKRKSEEALLKERDRLSKYRCRH